MTTELDSRVTAFLADLQNSSVKHQLFIDVDYWRGVFLRDWETGDAVLKNIIVDRDGKYSGEQIAEPSSDCTHHFQLANQIKAT